MTETALDGPRTWAEFADPADSRRRFLCDLTWLTSRWTCIYGRGCRSIFAAVPEGGCCVIGAHFANDADLERVAGSVARLTPELWQHHPGDTSPAAWTSREGEVTQTLVVATDEEDQGACIFLNREGFAGGTGCALHHLGVSEGADPIMIKPEACWQLPTRRTHAYVDLPDGSRYLEVRITEYDRRAWGPGGHDLHWFCTSAPEAHIGREPVFLANRAELIALMGEPAYEELVQHATAHLAAVKAARTPGARHLLPLVVHPATLAAGLPSAPPPPPKAKPRRRR